MDTVIDDFLAVDFVLVFQKLVESRLNVLNNWPPTTDALMEGSEGEKQNADLSSLFTKSPKPGVSTTVKRRRTPFSSMSVTLEFSGRALDRGIGIKNEPALMLSIATVLGLSALGGRGSLGW